MEAIKAGDKVSCYNVHTGATTLRTVKRVTQSGKKVIVERDDWKTGQAEFFLNGEGHFRCEYASEAIVANCGH